jgi:hypothetical protein
MFPVVRAKPHAHALPTAASAPAPAAHKRAHAPAPINPFRPATSRFPMAPAKLAKTVARTISVRPIGVYANRFSKSLMHAPEEEGTQEPAPAAAAAAHAGPGELAVAGSGAPEERSSQQRRLREVATQRDVEYLRHRHLSQMVGVLLHHSPGRMLLLDPRP